jgi:hypothetical protein
VPSRRLPRPVGLPCRTPQRKEVTKCQDTLRSGARTAGRS